MEITQLLHTNVHLLLSFVNRVARSPRLLDRGASILGPDLMLWSAEFFVKPAQTDKIVSWHRDQAASLAAGAMQEMHTACY